MRHRATLFGLLGGFLVIAAFIKAYHLPVLVIGFMSVSSLCFQFLVRQWLQWPDCPSILGRSGGDAIFDFGTGFSLYSKV